VAFRALARAGSFASLVADLCEALSCQHLDLEAADVGRYAWARLGFDFLHPEDREIAVQRALEFAETLGHGAIEIGSIKHSWELAGLPGPSVSSTELARARGEDPPPVERRLSFGQALLLGPGGNEWHGRMTLASGSEGRQMLAGRTEA
jgi:hypothetical protein